MGTQTRPRYWLSLVEEEILRQHGVENPIFSLVSAEAFTALIESARAEPAGYLKELFHTILWRILTERAEEARRHSPRIIEESSPVYAALMDTLQ